jgi:hypothetical protein
VPSAHLQLRAQLRERRGEEVGLLRRGGKGGGGAVSVPTSTQLATRQHSK